MAFAIAMAGQVTAELLAVVMLPVQNSIAKSYWLMLGLQLFMLAIILLYSKYVVNLQR